MTKRTRRTSSRRKTTWLYLDPYLSWLIFAGVGLGTLNLEAELRFFLLWLTLLGLTLLHAEGQSGRRESPVLPLRYSLRNVGRGAVLGVVLALPFLVLAQDVLALVGRRLYPWPDEVIVWQTLLLIAAPIEELFFRGVMQNERGLVVGAIGYGLAALVFFLPAARSFWVILPAMGLVMTALGLAYGYAGERYGLVASMACHAMTNALLVGVPRLLV